MVYLNEERAFIIEHYFRHVLYAKVHELFVAKGPKSFDIEQEHDLTNCNAISVSTRLTPVILDEFDY